MGVPQSEGKRLQMANWARLTGRPTNSTGQFAAVMSPFHSYRPVTGVCRFGQAEWPPNSGCGVVTGHRREVCDVRSGARLSWLEAGVLSGPGEPPPDRTVASVEISWGSGWVASSGMRVPEFGLPASGPRCP